MLYLFDGHNKFSHLTLLLYNINSYPYHCYRKKLCISCRNLPLKDFLGWGADYILRQVLRDCFQDVGCDGTNISEDIDLEVRVHIQSIVLTLDMLMEKITRMYDLKRHKFFHIDDVMRKEIF
jgi:hypothetical protein